MKDVGYEFPRIRLSGNPEGVVSLSGRALGGAVQPLVSLGSRSLSLGSRVLPVRRALRREHLCRPLHYVHKISYIPAFNVAVMLVDKGVEEPRGLVAVSSEVLAAGGYPDALF
jgi:hypothetical protein